MSKLRSALMAQGNDLWSQVDKNSPLCCTTIGDGYILNVRNQINNESSLWNGWIRTEISSVTFDDENNIIVKEKNSGSRLRVASEGTAGSCIPNSYYYICGTVKSISGNNVYLGSERTSISTSLRTSNLTFTKLDGVTKQKTDYNYDLFSFSCRVTDAEYSVKFMSVMKICLDTMFSSISELTPKTKEEFYNIFPNGIPYINCSETPIKYMAIGGTLYKMKIQ